MAKLVTITPIVSPKRVLDLTAPDGSHLIECYGLETVNFEGYVKAFDPEFMNGVGGIDLTDDIKQALRFKSFSAALECWKMQSETKPLREDGRPNRPMTAYSAQIVGVA